MRRMQRPFGVFEFTFRPLSLVFMKPHYESKLTGFRYRRHGVNM